MAILAALLAVVLLTGLMEPEGYTVSQDDEGPCPADVETWGEAAEYMAKAAWGEARSESTMKQAAVMWCILNRVDDLRFPDNVVDVVTQESQFFGYHRLNPLDPDLYALALDVISRWLAEKDGYIATSGRVLPREYVYFTGRGGVNYYGTEYHAQYGMVGAEWDWRLESPYEVER